MPAVPSIFYKLAGSMLGLTATPSAHQTLGVNAAGTAWSLRTPGWLDNATNGWAGGATFGGNVTIEHADGVTGNVLQVGGTSAAAEIHLFGGSAQLHWIDEDGAEKWTLYKLGSGDTNLYLRDQVHSRMHAVYQADGDTQWYGGATFGNGVGIEFAGNASSGLSVYSSSSTYVNSLIYGHTDRAANSAFKLLDLRAGGVPQATIYGDGSSVFTGGATFGGTVGLKSYTVATLPTPGTAGRAAYASNARNAGEGAAAGTGSIVGDDGTNWKIPGIAGAVAA